MKKLETLLKDYAGHVAERAIKGIPPLPLNAEQTNCVTKYWNKIVLMIHLIY